MIQSVHLDRLEPRAWAAGVKLRVRSEGGRPREEGGGLESRSVAARVPAAAQPGREYLAPPTESALNAHRTMTQFLRD